MHVLLARHDWALAVLLGLLAAALTLNAGPFPAVLLAGALPALLAALAVPPRWVLFAAIVALPLGIPIAVGGNAVIVPPSDFLVLPLLFSVVLRAVDGRVPIRALPADAFEIAFLILVLLSFSRVDDEFSFAFACKAELFAYIGFRAATVLVVTRGHLEHALRALAAMTAVLIASFYWWFIRAYLTGGLQEVFADRAVEGAGLSWARSNALAAYLALPLPLALAVALRPGPPMLRLGALVTVGFGVASVILSGSRGGMLGAAAGFLVLTWVLRHRARLFVATVAGVAVLLAALVVTTPVVPLALQRFTVAGSDESSMSRLDRWQVFVREIVEQPVLGHGFENEAETFVSERRELSGEAHNVVLKVAYQVGLPGLLLKAGLFAWFGLLLWRARGAGRRDPALYGLFAATPAVMLANGMTESVMSGDRYQFIVMTVMGLLVAWTGMVRSEQTNP